MDREDIQLSCNDEKYFKPDALRGASGSFLFGQIFLPGFAIFNKFRYNQAMSKGQFRILLYYKYVEIADPQAEFVAQKALCIKLGLKGRIIVAKEGINGTVEGTYENTEKYMEIMRADPRYADMHFKKSQGTETGDAFPRLSVKVRNEIVSGHLGEDDVDPNTMTGKRLTPEQLREWFEQGKDFSIVDMRNGYEHDVGVFRGTITPGMDNFRDLPKTIAKLEPLKEKAVLTVCTGGVRCEKASGYLKKKGFKEVYQLDGGIVSYMEKYPGKDFLGSLYVFDKRKVMHFDAPESHVMIGRCALCQVPCERYVNCSTLNCHAHFVCCESCDTQQKPVCKFCKAGLPSPGRHNRVHA